MNPFKGILSQTIWYIRVLITNSLPKKKKLSICNIYKGSAVYTLWKGWKLVIFFISYILPNLIYYRPIIVLFHRTLCKILSVSLKYWKKTKIWGISYYSLMICYNQKIFFVVYVKQFWKPQKYIIPVNASWLRKLQYSIFDAYWPAYIYATWSKLHRATKFRNWLRTNGRTNWVML